MDDFARFPIRNSCGCLALEVNWCLASSQGHCVRNGLPISNSTWTVPVDPSAPVVRAANLSDEALRAVSTPYALSQGHDDGGDKPNCFEFHLDYSASNLDLH